MVQVGIQGGGECWASIDQPDPCMTSPVNSSLMAFGLTEPPLQFQIVVRQFLERAEEQSRQKAGHQGCQVPGERVLLTREPSAEFLELTATVLLRALRRIERIGNGLEFLHLRT